MVARAHVRGREVHPRFRLVLAGVAVAAAFVPAAHAARAPVSWCAGAPTATDRPDTAGGDEIHVVYAHPSDSPDRFAEVASSIAGDIRGINLWWRGQDRTRVPRWDMAEAAGCGGFGRLDISDVTLPHDTAYYNQSTTPKLTLLRSDLVAAGFDDPAKKYLVYYDQAANATTSDCGAAYVSAQSGSYAGVFVAPNLESTVPGRGCGSIEPSAPRGGYLAVVAAHELVNALGALDDSSSPGPPHKCAGDPLHVCDNSLDLLSPAPSAPSIGKAILDFGHDDYYAHSGTWWDVQDSPWLRHLNEPEYAVNVFVGTGGQTVVDTNQPGISCAAGPACTWTFAGGSALTLQATAASGYRLLGWTGCPGATGDTCTLTLNARARIAARFAPPLHIAAFHLALNRARTSLTATLRLNAPGEANNVACTFGGVTAASSSVRGAVATCTWNLPSRFRGHRIKGLIELESGAQALLAKPFQVAVPAR